ncbi:hypothetical protein CP49_32615 [Bradyrhizobium valentinum]|uniref:Reverse transcriptase domain-containing protein n=2 Tax=Bradyrhizobium valentinum TaxID=1518501 RepID=A0A0R3KH46_9BRAD|nr:hypothetical protein CP49_32615 [Bradyrhizobium valentinum]
MDGTKGNADSQSTVRTQSRKAVSQARAHIREAVNRNKKEKPTVLLHQVSADCLRAAYLAEEARSRRHRSGDVGPVRGEPQGESERPSPPSPDRSVSNVADASDLHSEGGWQATSARIAAIEDKSVQAAVVMILTPIYEAEFLGFSYGFRPERSQHGALDALAYGIKGRNVRWVLDADIRSFFDTISHTWLVRFIEHRIGDKRIVRLIRDAAGCGDLTVACEPSTSTVSTICGSTRGAC